MRRCSRFLPGAIIITICALGICSVARAEDGDDRPLWNVAWITDTQTPECEWITTLLARLMANKPKIVIHTGDTRFEWANRCAWKDVVDLLRVETPPIEFHLAPATSFPQRSKKWPDGAPTLGFLKYDVSDTGIKKTFIPLEKLSKKKGYGPGGHPTPEQRDYSIAWEK